MTLVFLLYNNKERQNVLDDFSIRFSHASEGAILSPAVTEASAPLFVSCSSRRLSKRAILVDEKKSESTVNQRTNQFG